MKGKEIRVPFIGRFHSSAADFHAGWQGARIVLGGLQVGDIHGVEVKLNGSDWPIKATEWERQGSPREGQA